ncbi:protein FAM161A isoform X2 [Leptopilina heterotoma]|uniref:protein FAM161A isoform X2 n=1 Tax=Leptopilina heterotoma TaxID=63436 RepID=UPI001CA91A93|nr:protein FAM161A isoform X2 [Leptopilina heterotoma]
MNEHRGSSFVHSCVKVPVDPYSRQPTPLYERPRVTNKTKRYNASSKSKKINFDTSNSNVTSPRDTLENFMDFMESIPDYNDVHHLSNEQFKQKLDYLKRKQRILLKNLQNCLDQDETENIINREISADSQSQRCNNKTKEWCNDNNNDLKLKGRKCNFEESRTNSPILYATGTFDRLAEDQDLLTYRGKDKTKSAKTIHNSKLHSENKSWSIESESKSPDSVESDNENSLETKSLPPHSPERWHPTVPKPFNFTLREEAEKYMNLVEVESEPRIYPDAKKKKRRTRPIPLTSKIPLYDKLVAAKEERSRLVREESMLNLLSQVRPFKLECEKRAWKALSRSSPELCGKKIRCNSSRFKAKPVPKNLFNTDIYDRMLEDDYYRSIQKKMRASELMKSSNLPPSMARRERLRSTSLHSQCSTAKESANEKNCESRESSRIYNDSSLQLIRSKSALAALPIRGNNLAAVLRCQASREKMEREIQEKLDEKRREEFIRIRESLIGQKPAWKALRSAARHEHARDLDFRFHLRQDEAREQAERHRIQMEMMLSRVTRIPTLFERHSQSLQLQSKSDMTEAFHTKKIKLKRRQRPSSVDSYISGGSGSRSNSDSLTSSSGTLVSLTPSFKSSESKKSEVSTGKSEASNKKKNERGPLKVSINETAQLIVDRGSNSGRFSINSQVSEYHSSANVDNDKL